MEWPCPLWDRLQGCLQWCPVQEKLPHAYSAPRSAVAPCAKTQPQAFSVSYDLLPDQHDWACPDETPSSLHYKRLKGAKKLSSRIGETQLKKHRKAISTKHRSHAVVAVQPVERNNAGERGCKFFCKVCFTCLLKGKTKLTPDLQAALQNDAECEQPLCHDPSCLWMRVKANEPLFAANFAAAVGRSFEDMTKSSMFKLMPSLPPAASVPKSPPD